MLTSLLFQEVPAGYRHAPSLLNLHARPLNLRWRLPRLVAIHRAVFVTEPSKLINHATEQKLGEIPLSLCRVRGRPIRLASTVLGYPVAYRSGGSRLRRKVADQYAKLAKRQPTTRPVKVQQIERVIPLQVRFQRLSVPIHYLRERLDFPRLMLPPLEQVSKTASSW